MPKQVKTRILFLSDTHGCLPKTEGKALYPYRWPLPQADVVIHTGDLTGNGKISDHQRAVDLLKGISAELKVVIPGNHDLTLDTAYYGQHGQRYGPNPKYTKEQLQQIRDLYTGPEAQAANIVYMEEGTRTLGLQSKGALLTVYASAYTPEFKGWAFAYPNAQDRFNSPSATNPIPSREEPGMETKQRRIDIALTHGPPYGVLDRVRDGSNAGCVHLLHGIYRARPLVHCFGHIHEGWGAVRRKWPEKLGETAWDTSASDSLDIRYTESYALHGRSKDTAVSVDQKKVTAAMGAYLDATELENGNETLFLNSAIMNVSYRPLQAPWIVDLMLDEAA